MKKGLLFLFCVLLSMLNAPLVAQENIEDINIQDTTYTAQSSFLIGDTLTAHEVKVYNKQAEIKFVEDFRPNPTRAVLMSAIFPGLGQIYNKKYWKLPIIYGGFLGVIYAVSWNGNMYTDYQNAYKDIMLDPDKYTRWHDFVSGNPLDANIPETKTFLKGKRDFFRRNRDLAIIVGVGLYALCMIDAYVDAQLYNFTVTPDLSMTVAPVIWGPSQSSNHFAVGIQCNIVF